MVEEEKSTRIRRIGLIGLISLIGFFGFTASIHAASLYFSPSSGTYSVGGNFTVNVVVDSSDQTMNAAEGIVSYPTDKLTVVGVSKTGSIFNLWVQEPSFSNSGANGNVRFEGVVLNPGWTGRGGKILSITFRARNPGTANISYLSGAVLANDGDGTNILKPPLGTGQYYLQASAVEQPPGSATVLPPQPVIKHYVQNENKEWVLRQSSDDASGSKWVNSGTSRLVWLVPGGVTGISTILDDNPGSIPVVASQGLFDNRIIEGQKEGTHYFHIRFINAKGAGPTLHYKMMVDTTPPRPFKLSFPDDNITPTPKPRVAFSTTDDLSGLDHYEMKIGEGDQFRIDISPDGIYRLPKQSIGTHSLTVRAYDRAGNYTEAIDRVVIQPIAPPVITYYPQHITSPGQGLVLGGTASPNATVQISMTRNAKTIAFFTTQADRNGNWEARYPDVVPSGFYEVWADQTLENGAQSLKSNSVYIRVNSLFFRLWQWFINLGGFFLLFWILLILMMMVIYYLWHKYRMLKLRLRKEAHEAEEAFKYTVTRIREEVGRHEDPEQVKKDLTEMEQKVEKEIKDIDDLGK